MQSYNKSGVLWELFCHGHPLQEGLGMSAIYTHISDDKLIRNNNYMNHHVLL